MNKELLNLIAFWSAWFLSSEGDQVIPAAMRDKLVELLELLPPSFGTAVELPQIVALLPDGVTVGADHPINQAIFRLMVEHENEMPGEFGESIANIKHFFATRSSSRKGNGLASR